VSKDYTLNLSAHPSIYDDSERQMTVYFSEPDKGITDDTGLLLLISDYNEVPGSDIWTESRRDLADRYNVVTVQCEYFGQKFMQGIQNPKFHFDLNALGQAFTPEELERIYDGTTIHLNSLLEYGSAYKINMEGKEMLGETLSDFNDMGIMQAIDNLTAVFGVISLINSNKFNLNLNRLFAYGQGYGGYLVHLCNAFAPDLFSLLLDSHAWLYPLYLYADRVIRGRRGDLTYSVGFEYLARTLPYDSEMAYLPSLYKKFTNKSDIIACQYVNDGGLASKKQLYEAIPNCSLFEVEADKAQAESTEIFNHNPMANIVQLFDEVIRQYRPRSNRRRELLLPTTRIQTKGYRYVVDYSQYMPIFSRRSRMSTTNLDSPTMIH
jgi:hypothetical protein